jgi:hypothetical protein
MFIYLVQAKGSALGDADRRSQVLWGRIGQETAGGHHHERNKHRGFLHFSFINGRYT